MATRDSVSLPPPHACPGSFPGKNPGSSIRPRFAANGSLLGILRLGSRGAENCGGYSLCPGIAAGSARRHSARAMNNKSTPADFASGRVFPRCRAGDLIESA